VDAQARALGAFIRTQRRLAELSQRELARLADLSDAYVSKLERSMHHPTVGALRAIGLALNVRAEEMMAYAGWLDALDPNSHVGDTEAAIRSDERLTPEKKHALLAVYRSLVTEPPVAESSVAESSVDPGEAPFGETGSPSADAD
jgi:transcriptional regulator with XRE-family HTH domain